MTHGFATSLLLVCLLHFVILIKCTQPTPQCISSEREALTKFKSKLHDPFGHLATWDDGPNCCQWEGITCHNNTGYVIQMDIRSASTCKPLFMDDLYARKQGCWKLSGQLDPVLAQLKHLRYIDLSLNTFAGLPIPTFLGSMKELRYLNLSSAGFSGSVPKQLGNLSNLQVMDISSSEFFGRLLSDDLNWMKTMRSLKHLEMNHINLSTVSDWIHIFNILPNLESFHASACQFLTIGPNPLLVNFTSLRVLDLSYNLLPVASLFKWLTNFTALEFLDLSGSMGEYDGKVSNTLIELPNLQELILNYYLGKNVSKLFSGSWKKIRRLELRYNRIYGNQLPKFIGNMNSLEELVMSDNKLTGYLSETSIRNLKYLDLSWNRIEGIQVGNSTSLEHLDLSCNSVVFLQGEYFGNLIHLKYLNLASNKLKSSIPKELGLLTRLEHLDLSCNGMIGDIPYEIGNLTSLNSLDLSYNKLYGSVPREIGNLVKLTIMNLYYNALAGGFTKDIGKLVNLQQIGVAGNKMYDVKLEWLCPLKKLSLIDFSLSELTGPIPPCLGSMSSLTTLWLLGNKLNGTLPSSIGQLWNLQELDLHSNNLHGPISEAHFENMSKLVLLDLSFNFFKFQLPESWVPSFQLMSAYLRSCDIGPAFPAWLRTQSHITNLDMSNTSIADEIPVWFWNLTTSISYLYLSDNKIRGHLPNPFLSPDHAAIDLSNNLISGHVPRFPGGMALVDVSDNLLTGSMPDDICNFTAFSCIDVFLAARNNIIGSIPAAFGEYESITTIDLSGNSLSGRIPFNLGKLKQLKILDLSRNQLSGMLQWPLVLLQNLKSLNLEKNMITGRLPFSLGNCSRIEILDIGENKFQGDIPSWIGARFPALRVLRLRNNSFTGQIPSSFLTLKFLQVLDLAGNLLSDQIPRTVGSLRSMKQFYKTSENLIDEIFYQERVVVSMKGQMLEFSKTLSLVISIDFSFNNLSGHIPPELADLYGLVALNLSHNRLSGSILNNIGNLRQLFSLDLSWNELSGNIPPSISNLTYLSKLNLSYNELSGRIPTGQQLQTLDDPSIYVGNSQLCGHQLPQKCPGDDLQKSPIQPTKKISKGEDNSSMWFYVSLGTGFVSGFWLFYGVLIIKYSWRSAYFRGFDSIIFWLSVKFTPVKAKIVRKMQRG